MMEQPTLPLILLPFPLVLLPGARATFPLPANIADALLRLIESSPSNPLLAAVPLIQNEGSPSVNRWGVTARITRFVRPRIHSDEPHLLTLTGIARVRLVDPPPQVINGPLPLPHVDVSHPPPDSDSPPSAADIVQDFKAAAIRLLERFAQDVSQAARKRESWARIAQLVQESEPHKAATLADAIISAVGAEHADKLGACFTARVPFLPLRGVLSPTLFYYSGIWCGVSEICHTHTYPAPKLRWLADTVP